MSKDLVSWGLLQGAVEPSYRSKVRGTRLVRQYREASQRVEKVSDEVVATANAAIKDGLDIAHLDNALL